MKTRVLLFLFTLGITANYTTEANQPIPSYEWIGKYTQSFYGGNKKFPWFPINWEISEKRSSIIHEPYKPQKSIAVLKSYYPNWSKARYGIVYSVSKTVERQDGTIYSVWWNKEADGYIKGYKREENRRLHTPKTPTCSGFTTIMLTSMGKLDISEWGKLYVTANDQQVGSVNWDFVFNLTTESGNTHSCTVSRTLHRPNHSDTVSPCNSYFLKGFDCYNSVSIYRQ